MTRKQPTRWFLGAKMINPELQANNSCCATHDNMVARLRRGLFIPDREKEGVGDREGAA